MQVMRGDSIEIVRTDGLRKRKVPYRSAEREAAFGGGIGAEASEDRAVGGMDDAGYGAEDRAHFGAV